MEIHSITLTESQPYKVRFSLKCSISSGLAYSHKQSQPVCGAFLPPFSRHNTHVIADLLSFVRDTPFVFLLRIVQLGTALFASVWNPVW